MRPAGRGNSSNCITLAIAGMRRCSTVWCCARAATKPSTPVAAMRARPGKNDQPRRTIELQPNDAKHHCRQGLPSLSVITVSKGPDVIERRIAELFAATRDRALTIDDITDNARGASALLTASCAACVINTNAPGRRNNAQDFRRHSHAKTVYIAWQIASCPVLATSSRGRLLLVRARWGAGNPAAAVHLKVVPTVGSSWGATGERSGPCSWDGGNKSDTI